LTVDELAGSSSMIGCSAVPVHPEKEDDPSPMRFRFTISDLLIRNLRLKNQDSESPLRWQAQSHA